MASGNSPAFRTGLRAIERGDVLVPALRAYLHNPEFRGFDIKVRGIGKRPWDGVFHPSTHPSWTPKALWLYQRANGLLLEEPIDPSAILAMTAGSLWHAMIERSLLDVGLLVSNEVHFKDPDTKSSGSADGLVKEILAEPEHLFEFKTMKDMILRRVLSVQDFIDRHPTYYLQALEYMRMSGYRKMRFLLMAPTYPFEMKEFVIEYNHADANVTRDKYRYVLQAAADGDVPLCSGCKKGTFCPARAVCESATTDQIKGWISDGTAQA